MRAMYAESFELVVTLLEWTSRKLMDDTEIIHAVDKNPPRQIFGAAMGDAVQIL
jgi:hypothetical protein